MQTVLIIFFLLLGGFMALVAALGCLRFPDVYTRMHAATKSGTVGVLAMSLAMMCWFQEGAVIVRGIIITLFFLLTAPVAAHMIGRAAYRSGVSFWAKTKTDEWNEHGADRQQED